jgi:predicted RNA binding protein YcfA (HicA-like mRNA interferase family)
VESAKIMGKDKYPPLDRDQVESILKNLNFSIKRTEGDHANWEGYTGGKRRIVTVAQLKSKKEKYGHRLLNSMIRQSGLTRKEFYSYL